MVLTEWPEFAEVDPAEALGAMAAPAVVDARNLLDSGAWRSAGFAYTGTGF